VGVDIKSGVGPVMDQPYRTADDVARLTSRTLDSAALDPIREAVALTVAELGPTPLLGFGGAPFTLAAYLVEGRPSRDHLAARTLMHADPATWDALVTWTADLTGTFLRAQVEAGASAVQLFDSWAGSLSLADYASRVAASSTRALAHVADTGVPAIHFGTGTGHLLDLMREGGGDAFGVDHRLPLDDAWAAVGHDRAIQGNLDPAALLGPWDVTERKARDVLARAGGRPGHVFNLGHGVLPDTPVENLQRLVELVHAETERPAP
jgi:uroporphyrinogen decarboxylase